jgi:hypothetical protein
MRNAQLQNHYRNDDGKDTIAECLKSSFLHLAKF